MSEALRTVATAPADAGARLSDRCTVLAGSLARLVRTLPGADDAPLRGAHEFLEAMAAAGQPGPPPGQGRDGLDRLVGSLGMCRAEADLLVLAGMAEEHEGYASVFRSLCPRGDPWPTVGLCARLLCGSPEERRMLRALVETGPAVRFGVLWTAGDGPLFERGLRLAPALWSALGGIDVWPAGVTVTHPPARPDGPARRREGAAAQRARAAVTAGEPCTVVVTAADESVAAHRAVALTGAAAVGLALPPEPDPVGEAAMLVHALARGVVPVLTVPAPADGAHGRRVLPPPGDWPAPVVLAGRTGALVPRGTRPVLVVPVEPAQAADRSAVWRSVLPPAAVRHAADLAATGAVEPHVAADVAADLALRGRHDAAPPDVADVIDALRVRVGLDLPAGVTLRRPSAGWDDLVLPDDARAQLHEAVDRLRLRSRVLDEWGLLAGRVGARGVRMLFSGPPGTGKTLAAEVVAASLGADLLVVDIARVVSKWIGETEKNLAQVFDVAERAHAVLLFDEADALFGKRTEVSDAHDRYANLETAYLLMRLERFEGLAVLSTNLRQNIDAAFTRRLEFVLSFTPPGAAERARLWRGHLPAEGERLARDVDVTDLAGRFPVVGGVIRNAAVAAAFLAAADGGVITRDHLVRSLRREYDKSGLAFPIRNRMPSAEGRQP